jgi:hypothetical protein
MFIFDKAKGLQAQPTRDVDEEIGRLERLVADLKALRSEQRPMEIKGFEEGPIIDFWSMGQFPVTCLVGAASGHPMLPGNGRLIRTSDLWILSEDHSCARTLSRWYRLGRPFEALHETETVLS